MEVSAIAAAAVMPVWTVNVKSVARRWLCRWKGKHERSTVRERTIGSDERVRGVVDAKWIELVGYGEEKDEVKKRGC